MYPDTDAPQLWADSISRQAANLTAYQLVIEPSGRV
jgi:hypothetical protein